MASEDKRYPEEQKNKKKRCLLTPPQQTGSTNLSRTILQKPTKGDSTQDQSVYLRRNRRSQRNETKEATTSTSSNMTL